MGNLDKVIRILFALIVIGLYLAQIISGVVALVLIILAAILVITSMLGFCPLYLPFGINTDKKKN